MNRERERKLLYTAILLTAIVEALAFTAWRYHAEGPTPERLAQELQHCHNEVFSAWSHCEARRITLH
jgi:hypothetical protein